MRPRIVGVVAIFILGVVRLSLSVLLVAVTPASSWPLIRAITTLPVVPITSASKLPAILKPSSCMELSNTSFCRQLVVIHKTNFGGTTFLQDRQLENTLCNSVDFSDGRGLTVAVLHNSVFPAKEFEFNILYRTWGFVRLHYLSIIKKNSPFVTLFQYHHCK